MAIRTILHYPDKRLREHGKRVEKITPEIQHLVDDMAETMYAAPGVGLAATQIGEPVQIFVIDVADADQPSDLRVFINPEILERVDELTWTEGCLSFPDIREKIQRAAWVKVRAQNAKGEWFEMEGTELLARALQHEIDHLDGVLFIDRISRLKRELVLRKIKKLQKNGEW